MLRDFLAESSGRRDFTIVAASFIYRPRLTRSVSLSKTEKFAHVTPLLETVVSSTIRLPLAQRNQSPLRAPNHGTLSRSENGSRLPSTRSFSPAACPDRFGDNAQQHDRYQPQRRRPDPRQRRRHFDQRRHRHGRQHEADPGLRQRRQRHDLPQRSQRRAAEGEPLRRGRQRHAHRRLGQRPALRRGGQRHAAGQGRQSTCSSAATATTPSPAAPATTRSSARPATTA